MKVWLLVDYGPDCASADAFISREAALQFVKAEIIDGSDPPLGELKWEVSETNPDYLEVSTPGGHLTLFKTDVWKGKKL